jgi:hypothetical protein
MKETLIFIFWLGVTVFFYELYARAKEKNDSKKLVEAGLRQESLRREDGR